MIRFRFSRKIAAFSIVLLLCLLHLAFFDLKFHPVEFENGIEVSQKILNRSKNENIAAHDGSVKSYDERILKQLSNFHGPIGQNAPHYGVTVIVTGDECKCELLSVDCLDSIQCLPQDARKKHQFVATGVATRKAIKERTELMPHIFHISGGSPLGKAMQYSTIDMWKTWTKYNQLVPHLDPTATSIFVNETWYPYCMKHSLRGLACFLRDMNSTEDLDDLEMEALTMCPVPKDAEAIIREDLMKYLDIRKMTTQLGNGTELPALGDLLSFAHLARMRFNRQPHLRDIYKKRLQTIRASNPSSSSPDRLRVSLHLRRGDACDHKQEGYEKKASDLNSIAQTSGKRMCYDTSVYIDALRRVQSLTGRSLDVFLATDHAGSVIDEIRDDFKDAYEEFNWHFLNYSRSLFSYEGYIEGTENGNQPFHGESAIADLWHLSHGEVYIGHLGSQFGKVAWLLAIARHNNFVPFFTVDGHSFCCEVDEACGEMKPYVTTMENCMTFAHDFAGAETNKDYWQVGSQLRKIAFEQQQNGKRVGR